MLPRRLIATAVSFATALAVVLASPAHAERAVHRDGVDDLVTNALGEAAATPVTGYPEADIRKFVVRHGRRAVVIRVTLQSLQPHTFVGFVFEIKADRRRAEVSLLKEKGKPAELEFYSGGSSCPIVSKNIDRDRNRVTVRIPRSCLRHPAVVQVGALGITSDWEFDAVQSAESEEEEADAHIFLDDALRDGSIRRYGRITWGPKLRRG